MQLNRQTVCTALEEFAVAYGLPTHLNDSEKLAEAIDIYHRELSKQYSEETFQKALTVAWQQARRFPCLADFHRGFDAPDKDGPTMESLGL